MKRSTGSQRYGFGGARRMAERARQLVDEADQALDHERHESAHRLYEESLGLYRQVDDKDGILNVLAALALLADKRQDYAAARSLYEESVRLARSLKAADFLGLCLTGLAQIMVIQGEQQRANVLAREVLDHHRYQEDAEGIASAVLLLGSTETEVEEARAYYEHALLLHRDLDDVEGVSVCLCCIGFLAVPGRDNSRERACLEEALDLHEKLDRKQGKSYVLSNLGDVERYEGNLDRAAALYRQSLVLKQEIGDNWAIAYTFENSAALAVALMQGVRAARLFGAAFAIRECLGTPLEAIKREEYEANLAAARELLTPQMFEVEWERGMVLSVEQAVEFAIAAGSAE